MDNLEETGKHGWLDRRWPYRVALVAAALVFHQRVLFYPGYVFPWDFRAVHLPLAAFTADSFRRGELPLWDPFTYCGVPLYANIQAVVFYLPDAIATGAAALFGTHLLARLLAIAVVLQIVFAGWCTMELLGRVGARPAAAWAGANVYELGCFFAAQSEHMGAIQGACWLPLVWWSVVELCRVRGKWVAVLAIALSMTILAGLPQVAAAAFISAVALATISWAMGAASGRSFAFTLAACAWALPAAAIQFVPTVELLQNSVAKYRGEWLGRGGGMPPGALVSLVIPNYWSVFDPSKFHGPIDLTFMYLYSSVLGLGLAAAAVIWRAGLWTRVFTVLTLFSAFAMMGDKTLPGRLVLGVVPAVVRIGIHPEYFFCLFSLGLAVLAGLGAEALLGATRLQVAAGLVIACDLIAVSSGRPMNSVSMKVEPGIRSDSADGSHLLVLRLRELTGTAAPPWRVDMRPDVSFAWSSTAPLLRIPTADGCDPMAPERVIEMRRAFSPGPRWGTCFQVADPSSDIVNLAGDRYLLTHAAVASARWKLADEIAGYRIYESERSVPRIFLAGAIWRVATLGDAVKLLRSPKFDPWRETIVEGLAGELVEGQDGSSGRVELLRYAASELAVDVTASSGSLLVIGDTYYPGWKASIDGNPARIYPADVAFRGVVVPAGRHLVEMKFRPVILAWSAGISALAFSLLLGVLPEWGFRRRSGGVPGEGARSWQVRPV